MGVECDIYINEPSCGAFNPGDTVTGVLRYEIDNKPPFSRMIVTLKGIGRLTLTKIEGSGRNIKETTYYNKEEYVNKDNIIENSESGATTPSSKHEHSFNFTLPEQIPSSLSFSQKNERYKVNCNIVYYVCIQFEFPSLYNLNKIFNKEITVVSKITPRLPMEPTVHVEKKKLFQIVKVNECNVTIKASIQNSVIDKGGKVELHYEVSNDSNLTVRAIKTKLIEVYTFYPSNMCGVKFKRDVIDTDVKTSPVKSGGIFGTTLDMDLRSDLNSLENSKFVSRDYAVVITAVLPRPHYNAVLEIPIQIGQKISNLLTELYYGENCELTSLPPTYSESIAKSSITEVKNDIIYLSDSECDNEKCTKDNQNNDAVLESTIYINEPDNNDVNLSNS